MKRRSIIQGAGIAGVLSAGIAPAVHAQASLQWRLASSFPTSLDTIYGAAPIMAQKVSEMTGGRFRITVSEPGKIMPAFGVVDGVKDGVIEMSHTAPYYFFAKDPTFALACAIPFGLNSRQLTAWMFEGNGMKLMREFYANYNIVNFVGGNTGAQMGGWWRKEVKSLEDLKGVKLRVAGFAGRVLERMGAIPQNIPGGEIISSLEKGNIDAAEWVGPYDDEKLGIQKLVQNYAYPGFWEGGTQLEFHVNTKAYASLSAEYKSVLECACTYAATEMQARYDVRNPAALKRLVAGGARLFPFPKDFLDEAFKQTMAICSEMSTTNPAWKKIYEDYSSYRREANVWFRFADGTFDNYMQRQRL